MTINIQGDFQIRSNSNVLKRVDDYKYLGSYILNSGKDFDIRKGMAWSACFKMEKIWKSNLERDFKIRIFRATIEPVLLYGSKTWTLSAKQQHWLDGCHTRLLRRVQNLSWKNHPTLETIYGNFPRISSILMKRRVQFAGHCSRTSDELASSFVFWRLPSSHKRSRKLTFPDTICRDTSIARSFCGYV